MRSVGRFFWLGCILLFLAGGRGLAADEPVTKPRKNSGPVEGESRSQTLDQDTKTTIFAGAVVIRDEAATLRADRVRYDGNTKEAWADGNVRLNREGQEWVTPAGYYNFGTHVFKAAEARGFFDPLIVHAEHLETVSSNHYT